MKIAADTNVLLRRKLAGAETFVSIDRKAVKPIAAQGKPTRLLS